MSSTSSAGCRASTAAERSKVGLSQRSFPRCGPRPTTRPLTAQRPNVAPLVPFVCAFPGSLGRLAGCVGRLCGRPPPVLSLPVLAPRGVRCPPLFRFPGLRCRLGSSAVRVPASLSPMTGVEAEGLGRRTCTFRSSKRTDRRGGSATTAPACTISCNYGLQQERTRPDQDGQKRHSTRTFIAKDLRRTGALTSFPS